jgi:hypothetical protein
MREIAAASAVRSTLAMPADNALSRSEFLIRPRDCRGSPDAADRNALDGPCRTTAWLSADTRRPHLRSRNSSVGSTGKTSSSWSDRTAEIAAAGHGAALATPTWPRAKRQKRCWRVRVVRQPKPCTIGPAGLANGALMLFCDHNSAWAKRERPREAGLWLRHIGRGLMATMAMGTSTRGRVVLRRECRCPAATGRHDWSAAFTRPVWESRELLGSSLSQRTTSFSGPLGRANRA